MRWYPQAVVALFLATLGASAPVKAADSLAAPKLTLRDTRGSEQSLAQFRGRIVVLNFWATWCLPCREEMPLLTGAQKRFGDRIVVVAAALDDSETEKLVPEFIKKQKVKFPVWLGATPETLETFGLGKSLPATAFITPEGEITFRVLGQLRKRDLFPRLDWMLGNGDGKRPEPLVNNLK